MSPQRLRHTPEMMLPDDANPTETRASRTRRLILVGASGSGKTAIARRLSQQTSWRLYDSDAEIMRRMHAKKISDIFDHMGEATFRAQEAACLEEIRKLEPPVVVATGGGMPDIDGIMDELSTAGVCVYLRASVDTLWKRLNTDPRELDDRPLLRTGGKEKLAELLREREASYSRAAVTIDTDQLSKDKVCDLLVASLETVAT